MATAGGATDAGAGRSASGRRTPRTRRPWPMWLVVVANVLVALVVVSVAQAWVLRVHNVSSSSMVATLNVSDRVLSSPLPYLGASPRRGDIVIFAHGATWDDDRLEPASDPWRAALRAFGDVTGIGASSRVYTVKRLIGLPGDTVACCDAAGRVEVDGEAVDEPYIHEDVPFTPDSSDCTTSPRSARCFDPVTVPDGHYLVMGDNRAHSADSVVDCRREDAASDCARFVRAASVTGKVVAKAWPPGPVG